MLDVDKFMPGSGVFIHNESLLQFPKEMSNVKREEF